MTVWRKRPPNNILDWDFHISEDITEAKQTVENLKRRGIKQYGTYPIAKQVNDLSSEY